MKVCTQPETQEYRIASRLTYPHAPGECKHIIADYLKCLKSRRGVNDEDCRKLAKSYLGCRMDKYAGSGLGVELGWDVLLMADGVRAGT